MKQIQIANYLLSKKKYNDVFTYTLQPLSNQDPGSMGRSEPAKIQQLSTSTLSSLGFSYDEGIWKLPIKVKGTYFTKVQVNTKLGITGFVHRLEDGPISFPGIKYVHELRQLYKFITDQDLPQM